MSPNGQCAHLRVEYRTEQLPDGGTRGWWECASGCGMHFVPSPTADASPSALHGEGAPSHFPQHISSSGVPTYAPEHAPRPAPVPAAGPEDGGGIHGVVFLLLRNGHVLLEQCPKKRQVLGVGEWFLPGGKVEPGETALAACAREMREELGVTLVRACPLPIVEGSPVPPGPRGRFLMRPFVVTFDGELPTHTLDGGVPLRWVPIAEALRSPVPQVRMMVAAALSGVPAGSGARGEEERQMATALHSLADYETVLADHYRDQSASPPMTRADLAGLCDQRATQLRALAARLLAPTADARRDSRFDTGDPEMDAALAADDAKLDAMGAYNPAPAVLPDGATRDGEGPT